MSYGFQVINDNSFIQVDEQASVFAVDLSGTTGTLAPDSNSGYYSVTLNLGSGFFDPLLFVRPAGTTAWSTSGKKIYAASFPGVAPTTIYSNTNSPIDWFTVRDMRDVATLATSGYGLQVLDTSSPQKVVYTSENVVGKVHETIYIDPTSTSTNTIYNSSTHDSNIYGMVNTTTWSDTLAGSGFMGPVLNFKQSAGNYKILVERSVQWISAGQFTAVIGTDNRVFLSMRKGV